MSGSRPNGSVRGGCTDSRVRHIDWMPCACLEREDVPARSRCVIGERPSKIHTLGRLLHCTDDVALQRENGAKLRAGVTQRPIFVPWICFSEIERQTAKREAQQL